MESSLPPNDSNEKLMEEEEEDDDEYVSRRRDASGENQRTFKSFKKREWLTVGVLCYVNLINYMDRYTMAGIIPSIKEHFHFGDDTAGLLQTVFVISYMIFAPLFGYLGDRYNRKVIMAFGVFLWSFTTLLGSFMKTTFSFLVLRALVGIGEASYSTIAPTIISDLFVKDLRAKVLALFYFAIPVGSGLGYIVGSEMARLTHSWKWALRVTPIMGVIAVAAIIFVVKEPRRGESEGSTHVVATSWSEDLKLLIKNRSFMYSTIGFMSVAFVAGALSWWGPNYIYRGVKLQPGRENTSEHDIDYKFGIITMLSGVIGVPLGQVLASYLKKYEPRADPLICAFGVLASAPVLYFASLLPRYVVPSSRRSTAEAFQILISHMFGDAGSPYLVGVVANAIAKNFRAGDQMVNQTIAFHEDEISYYSLQYSLFMTSFVEFIGGIFFLLASFYIVQDKLSAQREMKGKIDASFSENGGKMKLSSEMSLLSNEKFILNCDEFLIDGNKERLRNFFADEPANHPSMI